MENKMSIERKQKASSLPSKLVALILILGAGVWFMGKSLSVIGMQNMPKYEGEITFISIQRTGTIIYYRFNDGTSDILEHSWVLFPKAYKKGDSAIIMFDKKRGYSYLADLVTPNVFLFSTISLICWSYGAYGLIKLRRSERRRRIEQNSELNDNNLQ